jgi:cytochrome c oxidase cbb3-type subunit 3
MNLRNAHLTLIAAAVLCTLSACEGGSSTPPANGVPSPGDVAAVPLGQLAGAPDQVASALSTRNPYDGNPQAIQDGKALYRQMNCAGCHAYDGTGNMGPDLTDAYWRYGGLPIQIYKSIHDGRGKGMPAWGKALPPQEIWKVVAYIQSLGGTMPASDYRHSHQGDTHGENVAPELRGLPSPKPRPSGPTTKGPKT